MNLGICVLVSEIQVKTNQIKNFPHLDWWKLVLKCITVPHTSQKTWVPSIAYRLQLVWIGATALENSQHDFIKNVYTHYFWINNSISKGISYFHSEIYVKDYNKTICTSKTLETSSIHQEENGRKIVHGNIKILY